MSVSKWAYTPEKCDGSYCYGDCSFCPKAYEDEIGDDSHKITNRELIEHCRKVSNETGMAGCRGGRMKYKYYKIDYEPSDPIHLPKGAEYKSYGEERYTPGPGFRAYGEVTTDRKMTIPEEIHYGLWEMK